MRFDIHWDIVAENQSSALSRPGTTLVAIWPAPVNHDQCFRAAGFTDFGDSDAAWDVEATALLNRTLHALQTTFGPAKLVSTPLSHLPAWYLRPFKRPAVLPIIDQLEQPMHCDGLARCVVEFGGGAATLSTGEEHLILWLTVPKAAADEPARLVRKLANGWPVMRTALRWQHLMPA